MFTEYSPPEFDVQTYKRMYPGFPEFVHEIMVCIAKGFTPEEAASQVSNKVNAGVIKTTINEIEATHATFSEDKRVLIPDFYTKKQTDVNEIELLGQELSNIL